MCSNKVQHSHHSSLPFLLFSPISVLYSWIAATQCQWQSISHHTKNLWRLSISFSNNAVQEKGLLYSGGANQGIISGQKQLTRHLQSVTILFTSVECSRCLITASGSRWGDWDKTQTSVDITELKCDMTGLSGSSQRRLSANSASAGSKCSSVFRKVTREQNLEAGRTLVWQTLSSLCSWPTSWKKDVRDPPSVQLCYFQIPGTLLTEALTEEVSRPLT